MKKEVLKKIKRLEIVTNKTVDSILGGQYHSVFKGQGIQFADFREYFPGDDVRNIAWKATAKTGVPVVKTFEEERELNVSLLVDLSSSNIFASSVQRKIDMSAELAALVAFSAIKNNDQVSLVTFSDRIQKYIPPKKGKKHVMRILSEILSIKTSLGRTDISLALEYISMALKRRSIIFVISDFITDQNINEKLKILSRKHDVIALWIYDKNELQIPDIGLVNLMDPETMQELVVDTSSKLFREEYKKQISLYYSNIKNMFKESKVDHIMIETASDYVKILQNYFKHRKKCKR